MFDYNAARESRISVHRPDWTQPEGRRIQLYGHWGVQGTCGNIRSIGDSGLLRVDSFPADEILHGRYFTRNAVCAGGNSRGSYPCNAAAGVAVAQPPPHARALPGDEPQLDSRQIG